MCLIEEMDVTQNMKDTLLKCVFSVLYKGNVHKQHLFCKNLAENSKTPQTTGSLEEHIERVHVQAVAWTQATIMKHHLLDPLEHSYYRDGCGDILPTTTKIPPAPLSTIELSRCQWKTYCKSHYSCMIHNILTCTKTLMKRKTARKIFRRIAVDLVEPIFHLNHVIHFNELL